MRGGGFSPFSRRGVPNPWISLAKLQFLVESQFSLSKIDVFAKKTMFLQKTSIFLQKNDIFCIRGPSIFNADS
jgi:hypothetical protein